MRTFFKETTLQRQIEATDRQIDALVYELYGPTEDARVVATDVSTGATGTLKVSGRRETAGVKFNFHI